MGKHKTFIGALRRMETLFWREISRLMQSGLSTHYTAEGTRESIPVRVPVQGTFQPGVGGSPINYFKI